MNKISVLIADDHVLIREAWALTIQIDPRFSVVAQCSSGKQAVEEAKNLRPDLILMDINLPDIDGIEATQQICKSLPGTKIIAVSSHTQPVYVRQIIQKGAIAYVTKSSSKDELFIAITEALKGKRYICEEIRNIFTNEAFDDNGQKSGLNSLTKKEIEVISLVKKGFSSKEVAEKLEMAFKTVEVHRYNILKKLKLKNTAALVNFTYKHMQI